MPEIALPNNGDKYSARLRRLSRFAWFVLAFTVFVILWGALVRATGSGAGCGNHWPLCNGEILPRSAQFETLVEFGHRLTSGINFLLVLTLSYGVFRNYRRGHPVRKSATLAVIFIIVEALIGAGLVLLNLVAESTSILRGYSTSLHLLNTFFLLASLTITAKWIGVDFGRQARRVNVNGRELAMGWFGVTLMGVSGAITALGDTLFPANSLIEGFSTDFSAGAHIFLRLRLLHPVLAVLVALYLLWFSGKIRSKTSDPILRRLSSGLSHLVLVQLAAGALNVFLLAPIWLQIVHLFLADLLWILLISITAMELEARMETQSAPLAAAVQA